MIRPPKTVIARSSHWSCIARRSLSIVPFGAAPRAHRSCLNFTVCSGLTTPQVVFAIIKVIIGPAILYLPHGFLQAGYGDTSAPQWRHANRHQHVPHQHQHQDHSSRRTSQSLVLDFARPQLLVAAPHRQSSRGHTGFAIFIMFCAQALRSS